VLSQQQMARRRNGDKLGDSLYQAEYDGNDPIRHPWDKRQIAIEDKENETAKMKRET
jgi:hypothetical protein